MADVPSGVNYGRVFGHFVKFLADSPDVGDVPDEVPLEGSITLTPLTTIIRFPTTVPPRLAVAQSLICPVIQGDIYPPGTTADDIGTVAPGVYVIASSQPLGEPSTVQWRATYTFNGISSQPNSVVFNVDPEEDTDLSMLSAP